MRFNLSRRNNLNLAKDPSNYSIANKKRLYPGLDRGHLKNKMWQKYRAQKLDESY